VGYNAARLPDMFQRDVTMWVFEEEVGGRKLSEIINQDHENVKYLPGRSLPENIIAVPDIVEATSGADLLIFVLPHQFIPRACSDIAGKLKPDVHGLSLIKGFSILPGGGIKLISSLITEILDIPVSVLMGANLANEVADEKFCESTIGTVNTEVGQEFKLLFNTDNFVVNVVNDAETVEICGALKNIVACAAGFCDGMELGDNTKAAIIRLGLKEMISFADTFHPGSDLNTFFESCGVADLITTCYGGRNRKVSEAFIRSQKSIATLEAELLNGQKLQGPETAAEVNYMLKAKDMENKFPLFTAVHHICIGEAEPKTVIEAMRNHPAHKDNKVNGLEA